MRVIRITLLVCSLASFGFGIENIVTATHGTVTNIDRTAKAVAIKTVDGTEHAFMPATHAATDSGKDVANSSEKETKVAVYSAESAGKSIVHFFQRI